MVTLWRPRFMRPKQDERDFRIEWRDQSIRRLEELLKITQDQLVETCRRKGIRDEENNRLRGEVDRLKKEVERWRNIAGDSEFWRRKKDETIVRLTNEVERLKKRNDELQRLYRFVSGCDCEDRIEVK